ncbi:hypothetical protein K488DRAFT_90279 [Vararia minispora EC-137]|uniref:Uncharacterized protein n=1 Tax=Vararia minispora EC-137 TaxID=1314806 RepID=A0ACB8Q8N0_9AGAM|nr:hypothetical protein K488DRAFT_90279 [Vararia minispora EC-137]
MPGFSKTPPYITPPVPDQTPINVLPVEILAIIFNSGADMQAESANPGFEVLVSHVCQRWRTVALKAATLWNRVSFDEGPPFERSRTYIERSRKAPLYIEINCDALYHEDDEDPTNGPVFPEDLPAIYGLILPHVGCWRSFKIMVRSPTIMHRVLLVLSSAGPAPELHKLVLIYFMPNDRNDADEFFYPASLREPLLPFGGIAPNLRHLELWGVHLDWECAASRAGLETLQLAYHARDVRPSFAAFAHILSSSPALRRLALIESGPAGGVENWPELPLRIRLGDVDQLVFVFLYQSVVLALLARLELPALRHLTLGDLDLEEDAGDHGAVLRALVGDGEGGLARQLESLEVAGLRAKEADVRALYNVMPGLQTFELDALQAGGHFFNCLLPAEGAAPLPCLESLKTTGISGRQMCAIVKARAAANMPLKRVSMARGDVVSSKQRTWLRKRVDFTRFGYVNGYSDSMDD